MHFILKKQNIYWLTLLIILLIFHANHPLDGDEGVVLEGAWNIINGRELYTDFWQLTTPGVYYLIAWLWKITGVSYWSANLLGILTIFTSAIGIYKISQLITNSKLNYLGPSIFAVVSFYWPLIIYHNFNLFFLIWATYFFIKALKYNLGKYYLYSGLLTGLAILFLQNKGIVFLTALFSFLIVLAIKEKQSEYIKQAIYYFIFSILPLAILFIKWPASLLYKNLIAFPLFEYTGIVNIPFMLLILFLLMYMTFTVLVCRQANRYIWLLLYLQLILFISTLSLPDHFHITLIIFPLYILLASVLSKENLWYSKLKALVFFFVVLAILPAFNYVAYRLPGYTIVNSPLFSYIKDNCQQIYAGPFIPGIYFESRKLNPTPFSWLITNHHTEGQFLEARQHLESNQPDCVIFNYASVMKYNYNVDNPVDDYIRDNYNRVWNIDTIDVYKKL